MSDVQLEAMIEYAKAQKAAAEAFLEAIGEEAEETEAPAPKASARKAPPIKKATPAKATPAKKAGPSKAKPAPEPEPEEDEDDGEHDERWDELSAMRITALRALAKKRGFKAEEVDAEKDKATLVEAIWNDEKEDADEDDDTDADDESGDEDDTEVQYTRKDLKGKGLRELKQLAREAGYEASELRGKDADSIIDLLLGEGEGDDEDSEDDEDAGEWTEEQLREMSPAELKKLCKDYGVAVPRPATVDSLVDALMEAGEEQE